MFKPKISDVLISSTLEEIDHRMISVSSPPNPETPLANQQLIYKDNRLLARGAAQNVCETREIKQQNNVNRDSICSHGWIYFKPIAFMSASRVSPYSFLITYRRQTNGNILERY